MLKWDFDKGLEYADKLRPILQGLCNGEIWYVLVYLERTGCSFRGGLTARTWLEIVGCEVSQEEFEASASLPGIMAMAMPAT